MTERQLQRIATDLRSRRDAVASELRRSVARARDESFVALAEQGKDAGDLSVAALIAELGNAQVDRQLGELQELEYALQRISDGRYAVCVECGDDIAYGRLRAQPAAKRCLDCQRVYEHTHAHPTATRL